MADRKPPARDRQGTFKKADQRAPADTAIGRDDQGNATPLPTYESVIAKAAAPPPRKRKTPR
jgi:hypothetical protein